jgi:hypothetical protein
MRILSMSATPSGPLIFVRLEQRIAYITRNDALTALQERVAEPEGGDDDDGVQDKPD